MADLTAFHRRTMCPVSGVRPAPRPAAPLLGNCKDDLLELVVQRRRPLIAALFGHEQEPTSLIDLRPAGGAETNGRHGHG
ncbi:hypothetical protein [Mycobacteroides abscessus]|uniref:hypothetical protein n=1 Tax=Mycobacteroides abscessus TaxID=36809 RepID=UPI001041DDDD|nr:hypothetical protein [Mycobacteroides abscessus]